MPKCHGIAANGKPQSDKETVSPAVGFQDPCVHHHSLPPAFDGSITSPYCSSSRAKSKTNGASLRQSRGARTCRNEPSRCDSSGQTESETPSACGKWCKTGIPSPSFGYATVQQWNGKYGMQGSKSGRLEQSYFIREISAVYSMRVFATFCLSSGAVLPLYTPSRAALDVYMQTLLKHHPCIHLSKKEQNKGILMTDEKPSHFVTEADE